MPTWQPRGTRRCGPAPSARARLRGALLASSSMRERLERTSANSAATKNPFTNTSTTRRTRRKPVTSARGARDCGFGPSCPLHADGGMSAGTSRTVVAHRRRGKVADAGGGSQERRSAQASAGRARRRRAAPAALLGQSPQPAGALPCDRRRPGAARAPFPPRCRPRPPLPGEPSCAGRASRQLPIGELLERLERRRLTLGELRLELVDEPRGRLDGRERRFEQPHDLAAARLRVAAGLVSLLRPLPAPSRQLLLELLDRAVDQHLGGALRAAERARDLAIVHAERKTHDQRLTAVLGQ